MSKKNTAPTKNKKTKATTSTKKVTPTAATTTSNKNDNSWVFFAAVILAFLIVAGLMYSSKAKQLEIAPSTSNNDATQNEEKFITSGGLSLLTANDWQWSKTIMNDGTIETPNKPEAFVMKFREDGSVFTSTDCNSGRGGVTVTADNRIQFGPMATTMMFCMDSQEAVYLTALAQAESFFIRGDQLVFQLPYDSGTMIFDRLPN